MTRASASKDVAMLSRIINNASSHARYLKKSSSPWHTPLGCLGRSSHDCSRLLSSATINSEVGSEEQQQQASSETAKTGKAPATRTKISLCQLNNHPDYRLSQAKARLANNLSTTIVENPVRSNDGTSSGAIAADRLRMARRKALENIKSFPKDDQPTKIINTFQHSEESSSVKKEQIIMIENPVRSNDGTSSGAVAADRLRLARRKAIESINKQAQNQSSVSTSSPQFSTSIYSKKKKRYHEKVREHGIRVQISENSMVKNDRTSSGAVAADRLRMARRKAIEKLAQPLISEGDTTIITSQLPSASPPKKKFVDTSTGMFNTTDMKGGEHNKLDALPSTISTTILENPERSSDGTSSGALAADRLRMARRRALESVMKKN